ncbi:hypothetical protein EsDP_00005153 [Epichloe bromicola]|uniref:SET domain-containing protein n=1 Tax=Epichloe bromicola TaxID=79588 RepID=A0ABQ0CTU2_9HYPO
MGLLCLASLLLVSTFTPSSSAKVFPGEDMSYLGQRPQQPIIFADEPSVAATPPKALQTFSSNSSQSSHSYHVYSSRDFAGGRGISIVTTEERIKKFQDVTLAPGINDNSSPPFLEQDIPGKGRGIIATKLLHRGDRIFAHTPLLMIDADVFDGAEFEWSALEEEAVNNLPAESQKMFWELFGQPVLHPVSGRIDPNAFDLDMSDDEDSYYGVFPETARMNHDCRPNAAYYFDNNTLTHYVHAITDIPPGAEISITYIDISMPRKKRVAKLLRTWGFNCSCSQCSLPSEFSRASDQRLDQLIKLSGRFEDGLLMSAPTAERLVSLFHQERMHSPAAEAYTYAAVSYCMEGKYTETLKWATLALEFSMLDSGPHSPIVKMLAKLVGDPERQDCWLAGLKGIGQEFGNLYGGKVDDDDDDDDDDDE